MAEKEYIERGELIRTLNDEKIPYNADVNYFITNAPAADVVEVRHGEWEIKSEIHQMIDDIDEELYVECPFCRRTFYVPYEFEDEKIIEYARRNYPYCHCGAKMDGGKPE